MGHLARTQNSPYLPTNIYDTQHDAMTFEQMNNTVFYHLKVLSDLIVFDGYSGLNRKQTFRVIQIYKLFYFSVQINKVALKIKENQLAA